MQFNRRNINKILRNGDIVASSLISSYSSSSGSGGGGTLSGNYLPATIDENSVYVVPHYVKFQETTYSTDTEGNEIETVKNLLEITKDGIKVNGNIFATGEVAAYRSGTTTGGTSNGSVTIYDGLDSTSVDVALSANQGRILKELYDSFDIDSISTTLVDLTDTSINTPQNGQILFYDGTSAKWINKTFDLESSAVTQHIADTVKHITEEERIKWNNKLDKSIWDSAFYFDDKNNLRVKVNVVGEQEISAYGAGTSTSSGAITIVDNLTSTLADAALSANQGRVLKDLIDSANLGDLDLSDYSKTSHTHNNYSLTSHTHSYAETTHTHPISAITNLQENLDAKSGTGHTHNYASKVKVGSTEYTVSANTISLPSYPTLSSLSGVSISTFNTHTGNTSHITSTERTNWNKVYNDWNDVFTIDANGNLKVKVNLIGEKEVSAYGSGSSTSSGAITIVDNLNSSLTDAALSANQGRVLKDLIDSANLGDLDLSGYSLTSHTHSNYSLTSHTHSNYSLTSHTHNYAASEHTHPISAITSLQTTLDGKSGTGHSHSNYSTTSHTHSDYSKTGHTHSISNITNLQSSLDGKSGTGHTHNYASTVKVGSTSYSSTANTISLPSYPTLSSLSGVSTTTYNTHTGDSTAHITSTERTNWNTAYNNSHTHSNKSVLDGITSTKVSNWDSVYKNWTDVFTIDSSGNLKVKVNLIGEKEVSAYGAGTSTSSGAITIVDNLTSTLTDAALSANQGRVLKSLIDSANLGDLDLSGYSKTSHTHSNYSLTSHTHNYAASDHTHTAYSPTSHTHSNYSLTSHTHSYAASTHTHPISAVTNLQSTLDGKSGTGHSHSNYSLTSHTHSNYSTTSHTHSLSALTSTAHTHTVIEGNYTANGGQQAPNYFGKNRVGALMMNTTVNGNSDYKDWLFMDCYSGNDVGGGVAFGVNRQNLGAYIMRSASGRTSWAASAELIGTHNYTKYCATSGHTHSAYSPTSHTHSNYSLTSHTHSAYASSSHTHSISNITNLQSSLDAKSGTGHSHSNYSLTSHTHSAYYDSAISRTANTVLAAPNGSAGSATFRSLVAADIPTLAISKISGLQTALDGKAATHTHPYASSSHTHSTLTFSAGTFSAKSYNPSGATTVNIPTNTTHLTNGSGYITTAATVNAANKLATARTLWGQSFSGTANVSGNMTGVGSISASGNITTSAEITAHSDRRLKDNIQPLENRGYVTPYTYTKDGKRSIGFVAQEMQELYPELVSVDESSDEKYLSVNYMQYTAVLQQQIIDLKKEIDELKEIIKGSNKQEK